MVTVGVVLMFLYMYPMIFAPMFGGRDGDNQKKLDQLKAAGVDPSATRPSNMPDWSSPFGPKWADRGGDR